MRPVVSRSEKKNYPGAVRSNKQTINGHMVAIGNTQFRGATGRVMYNLAGGGKPAKIRPSNRVDGSLMYGAYNFRNTNTNGEGMR